MRTLLRVLFIVGAIAAIGPPAQAQIECSQCDPDYSFCDESCWWCRVPGPDGYCADVAYSTCGGMNAACLNCDPTWSETGRVTGVGTYGESHWNFWDGFSCDHHRVDRVTQSDTSHCNQDSNRWTRQLCDDVVDGSKYWDGDYVDCCDGYGLPGVPNSLFTCNHWHSCF